MGLSGDWRRQPGRAVWQPPPPDLLFHSRMSDDCDEIRIVNMYSSANELLAVASKISHAIDRAPSPVRVHDSRDHWYCGQLHND
jgi:hypothetical protein